MCTVQIHFLAEILPEDVPWEALSKMLQKTKGNVGMAAELFFQGKFNTTERTATDGDLIGQSCVVHYLLVFVRNFNGITC